MKKADKKIYDRMNFFQQAEFDSLAVSRNHWETMAKQTDNKESRKLYKEHAAFVQKEMDLLLNEAEVS